jgi:SAM-dependent methyltransferase
VGPAYGACTWVPLGTRCPPDAGNVGSELEPSGARGHALLRDRNVTPVAADRRTARSIFGPMGEKDAVDKWAAWLLHRRDGDDAEQRKRGQEFLLPLRQRVLDNAQIVPGEVVLDVGAGDGLIAFGALDRVGVDGRVIVSDVSDDLLSHARSLATELGVEGRMSFVRAAAEDLSVVADASVDVLTTRSVLIFVDDKAAAFRAFHRVLRPGGRLSIFEPINNYFPRSPDEFWGSIPGPFVTSSPRSGSTRGGWNPRLRATR